MINLFQPSVGDEELAAIGDVFASNWLGAGPRVEEFKRAFATHIGRPPAELLAVASCTEGLFQAVAALRLRPGDEVILPSISFIGAAHAVRNSGARVVLCDVNPITLNPTAEHVDRVATSATRAVLILHYGGGASAVGELAELARARSLALIEDSACSLGSFSDGQACGTFGDIGVWSFDAMKVVTTGDGGMVWCRDPNVARRVRAGVTLGNSSTGYVRRRRSAQWWEGEPQDVGRRAILNDVAAAIGLVQLRRLPTFLSRRDEITRTYDEAFADLPWMGSAPPRRDGEAKIFYWIQTTEDYRDRLAVHLLERDIYTSFRYWPLHRTRIYRTDTPLPGADAAAASTLLLPLHQGLSDDDVGKIIDGVRSFEP